MQSSNVCTKVSFKNVDCFGFNILKLFFQHKNRTNAAIDIGNNIQCNNSEALAIGATIVTQIMTLKLPCPNVLKKNFGKTMNVFKYIFFLHLFVRFV